MTNFQKSILALLLCMSVTYLSKLHAQTLNADGNSHEVNYNGSYQNFDIPAAADLSSYTFLNFMIKGADGGAYKGNFNKRKGGGGATVRVTFEIGTGPGQLQPGGQVRIIVGDDGQNDYHNGVEGGGGGGGSAVLYKHPGAVITCNDPSLNISDANDCWVLLGVAGGGGGAFASDISGTGTPGKSANAGECGSSGVGPGGGNGGCNGQGGGRGDDGTSIATGGGGGALADGDSGNRRGRKGGFTGGDGGDSPQAASGGFGYGGGGAGGFANYLGTLSGAGGGGGYSGGGGGYTNPGGGGGSFANASVIASVKEGGVKDQTPDEGVVIYEFSDVPLSGPVANCKNHTVSLTGSSVELSPSVIDDASSVEPGETKTLFFVKKVVVGDVTGKVPVSSLTIDCSNLGEKRVSLWVQSTSGLAAFCSAIIEVEDEGDPEVSCTPFSIVAPVSASEPFYLPISTVEVSSSDNCGSIAGKTLSQDVFTCDDLGSPVQVTLSVQDPSGNIGTCTATVSAFETGSSSLAISCPADIVTIADPSFCAGVVDAGLEPTDLGGSCSDDLSYTVTRNVNGVNQVLDMGIGPLTILDFPVGLSTVTYSYSNNSSTVDCSFSVTVDDDEAPTAVCQNVTTMLDAGCSANILADAFDGGSSDNCAIADYSLEYRDCSSGPCFDIFGALSIGFSGEGSKNVRLTVTDESGNTASCTASVTVEDQSPPTAACQDISIQLDASGNASLTAQDLEGGSTDNCGSVSPVSLSQSAFDCSELGMQSVTLTVEDGSGNQSTCQAMVEVLDEIAPVAVCVSQTQTILLDGSGHASLVAADLHGASTDNCGSVSPVSLSQSIFDCSEIGMQSVTLTVEDGSGNQSTCQAMVEVVDEIAPVAVCVSQTQMLALDGSGHASLAAGMLHGASTDNCGSVSPVSLSQSAFSCSDIGMQSVTLTVEDGSGNQSTCQAMVEVVDEIAPVAVCVSQTQVLALDGSGHASLTASDLHGASTDNCGSVSPVSLSQSAFSCSDIGLQNVTLTVEDGSGNQSTCQAMVEVVDEIAPVAVCVSQTQVLALDGSGHASLAASDLHGASTDNCGSVSPVSVSQNTFDCSEIGVHSVTLTVEDGSGNQSSCQATVEVVDEIAPVAVCVSQTQVLALDGSGQGSLMAGMLHGASTDNCGSVIPISLSQSAFSCSDIGIQSVTLTVEDGSGNQSTCQAMVEVVDEIAPVAVCVSQTHVLALDGSGQASLTAVELHGASTDNCGSVSPVSVSQSTFDCSEIGVHSVTLTVEDGSGNQSTCQAMVEVVDGIAPVAMCKENHTLYLDEHGESTLLAEQLNLGSTDNCGAIGVTFTNGHSSRSYTCDDANAMDPVTIRITDSSGNEHTCTTEVSIIDNLPPDVVCQPITVELDENGSVSFSTNLFDAGSTDNCGGVTSNYMVNLDCNSIGTNTVLVIFNDENGNVGTCQTTYTVVDNIQPVARCKSSSVIIYLDAGGSATLTPSMLDDGSSDNCGPVSLFFEDEATLATFSCSDVFSVQSQELIVKDARGNQNTCFGSVEVRDNIAPTAVCQDITVALGADGTVSISGEDMDGGSYDNCDNGITLSGSYTFGCNAIGAHTVEVEVEDSFNNASSCLATVTVIDDIPPTPVCLDQTVTFNGEPIQLVPSADLFDAINSIDNCGGAFLSAANTDVVIECDEVGSLIPVILTAEDDAGNEASCTANIIVEGLPCAWRDIGGIGCYDGLNTSNYDPNSGTYSMVANNCAPEFPYSHESTAFIAKEMCGDGEIIAEVTNVEGIGYAGVMMRDDLSPNAPMVAMGTNRVNWVRKQVRILPSYPAWPQQILSYDKFWVKITRTGNLFQAYASTDGSSWTMYINQQVIMSNNCLQVGLYAYSEKPGTPLSASFNNVYVTGQAMPLIGLPKNVEKGESIALQPDLRIYPNPTQDVVYIDLGDYPDQRANIQLFNGFGQQLLNQKMEAGVEQLDVSALAPGVYSAVAQIGDWRVVRRLVIARE